MGTRTSTLLCVALLLTACEPEPGCDRAACEGAEQVSCINFCAPTATYDDLDTRVVVCPVDPCDEAALERSELCPAGYRCQGESGAALGECVPADRRWLFYCDVGDNNCHQQFDCVSFECDVARDAAKAIGLEPSEDPADGLCVLPRREGAICDSDASTSQGCLPCEAGTYCVPAADGQNRCRRHCGDEAGNPDPGICPCDAPVQCETLSDTGGSSPPTPHFCNACIPIQGGQECDPDGGGIPCCEAGACNEVVRAGVARNECCRGAGDDCLDGELNQGCCDDTVCVAGSCEPCQQLGSPAQGERCCEGYVEATDRSGNRTCLPCDVGPHGGAGLCSPNYLLAYDGEERFDAFTLPRSDVHHSLPPYTSGGELDVSREDLQFADYLTEEEHRIYLFEGSLRTRLGEGARYVVLPHDPGSPATAALSDLGPLRSARVFDSGACSITLPYVTLSQLLAIELNKEMATLATTTGIQRVELDVLELTPSLQQAPLYGSLPRGPQDTDDAVRLDAVYQVRVSNAVARACFGSRDIDVRVRTNLRVGLAPGWVETSESQFVDRLASTVGCSIDSDGRGECVVPGSGGLDSGLIFREVRLVSALGAPDGIARSLVEQTHCTPDGFEYDCQLPEIQADGTIDTDTLPVLVNTRLTRPVLADDAARDLTVDVSPPDVDLDGCRWLQRIVQIIVRRRLTEIDTSVLSDQFTQDATRLGVPVGDLPTCASNDDCRAAPIFGGRRHSCFAGRCRAMRVEPRRINVRTEGLEVVLAETADDPQRPLIENANLSPLPGAGSAWVGHCAVDRYPGVNTDVERSERAVYGHDSTATGPRSEFSVAPALFGAFGLFAASGEVHGPICDAGSTRQCTPNSVCAETGTTCRFGANLGLVAEDTFCTGGWCCPERHHGCPFGCRDVMNDERNCGGCSNACLEGETCLGGECECPPDRDYCAGATRVCADLFTDERHCGACGNACEVNETCRAGGCFCEAPFMLCDGECVRPRDDPRHCGGCGNVCSEGQTCANGLCCAEGLDRCTGVGCVDLRSDVAHCGGCFIECGERETCVDAECVCEAPWLQCGASCVDPAGDDANCGRCGRVCAEDQRCEEGECIAS